MKRVSKTKLSLAIALTIAAYRTKSVCENPYNTRYLLVL